MFHAMRAAILLREGDEDRIHVGDDGGGKNSAYRPTLQWATLMPNRAGIKSYRHLPHPPALFFRQKKTRKSSLSWAFRIF